MKKNKEQKKQAAPEKVKQPLTGRAYLHFVLAIIFPGLGHLLLGKKKRALAFAVSIVLFFFAGLLFNGYLHRFGDRPGWLAILAVLSCMAVGLPYLVAIIFGFGMGDPMSIMEPYANYFLIAAGLLNILVAMDAMDIAAKRKE
jgi:hypothetical protein